MLKLIGYNSNVSLENFNNIVDKPKNIIYNNIKLIQPLGGERNNE